MNIFIFSTTLSSRFIIPRRIQCHNITNVNRSSCNVQIVVCFLLGNSRCLSSKSRRFGNLYQFHLQGQVDEEFFHPPALEDGTDRGFRNVGF